MLDSNSPFESLYEAGSLLWMAVRFYTERAHANTPSGIAVPRRHVIAIGRSPSCRTYSADPRNTYGAPAPNSVTLCSRANNRIESPERAWLMYRCPVAEASRVVDCDSQWNRVGEIA